MEKRSDYMILYIVLGVILFLLILFLIFYNRFVKLNNRVKEAFSTMDVYLKKRWDLVLNLVETVKGYTKHEQDTLEEIVRLRSGSYDDLKTEEKLNQNHKLSKEMHNFMILAESYPELKANESYQNLMKELTKIEDDIENARKYYNATVRMYNDQVEMFPSNILAAIFGYKCKEMFEADEKERENVKVKL